MVLIQKREWRQPNGEPWITWAVRWLDGDGREHMKVFDRWRDAESFFDQHSQAREAGAVASEIRGAATPAFPVTAHLQAT